MNDSALRLSFPAADVACLEFDQPGKGVNLLSRGVLAELAAQCTSLAARSGTRGLLLRSAKPHCFLAGADINEISHRLASTKQEQVAAFERGQELFRRFSQLPFPTVAVVSGVCLGGGAELATWCDGRVFCRHPQTEFGFPEVKLGVIPGWGGTVRLPRLIGLASALQLITSGDSLTADQTWEWGLADDVVSPDQALSAALALLERLAEGDTLAKLRSRREHALPLAEAEREFVLFTSRAKLLAETGGNYPAPLAAVQLLDEASRFPVGPALQAEARTMGELLGSPVNRALLHVYHATGQLKKGESLLSSHTASTAAPVKRVGVVGGGIMGAGIVAALLKREIPVTLVDSSPAALAAAQSEIALQVAYNKAQGGADPQRQARLLAHLQLSTHVRVLADCDVVIEAIAEQAAAKIALYHELEAVVNDDTLIASNTSTIPITQLGASLRLPERFCGLHFFNPVRLMRLVEVIRGERTSTASLARAAGLVRQMTKLPLIARDAPGFVVNRILSPYLNAALELLGQGVEIATIDRTALEFGMPIGPLALYDLVGFDTALQAGRTMWEAFPQRFTPSPIIPALFKAGRLGRKNGQGFYRYARPDAPPQNDPAAAAIVANYVKQVQPTTPEKRQQQLFLPMVIEAARVLEEGIVSDPRMIDAGLIYGLGFPAFRGGLLYWADQQGLAALVAQAEQLAPPGKSANVSPLLAKLASAGQTFHALGQTQEASDVRAAGVAP